MRRELAIFAVAAAAILGSASAATPAHAAVRCTITGTPGDDTLRGTAHRDIICGLGGNDTIYAGAGNDVVSGGPGNDVIYPGPGKDRVYAGADNDLIYAYDRQRDLIDGGPGIDRARIDPKLDRTVGVEGFFPAKSANPVLLAAGDIADCTTPGYEGRLRTAPLLDAFPTAPVAALGDEAYPSGALADFMSCYGPTWGRAKARTHPTPGNHEYETPGASGYYSYFGPAAGDPSTGYYSYDLGRWHVVVLNSNREFLRGEGGAGSPGDQWRRHDLATHPTACTLAYWHHPRFSSGRNGSDKMTQALWQSLQDAGADVVLVGHDHDYERFAPQDADGTGDPARGIREFVVGTGGGGLSGFFTALPNSEVREATTYGILKLTLAPASYSWQFIPEAGRTFADSGSAPCH